MKPEDKAKPVTITVRWHPKTLALARAIGEWLNGSSVDHVSEQALLDSAKEPEFKKWHEQHPWAGKPEGSAVQVVTDTKPRRSRSPKTPSDKPDPETKQTEAVA